MSPLWRDRLLVWLAPGELAWLRVTGRLKPEVIAKRASPIELGYGSRPWDGAVEALRSEAAQWQQQRLSVRIVLSNHLVRYALVPPSDAVTGHDEELALARFHFQKVHGDVSRGWDVRLSPARAGVPRMACAVDSALLDALKKIFPKGQTTRLEAVQPLLMSVFNHADGDIPGEGAWLLIMETDRACLALFEGNTWHAVQNVKGQFADAAAWIDLIERERWRIELDTVPDTVLVHSITNGMMSPRTYGTWKIAGLQTRWPAGLSATRDGAYRYALLGA